MGLLLDRYCSLIDYGSNIGLCFREEEIVGGYSLLIQKASFKIDLHPYDTESKRSFFVC